ncbi:Transglutaminase-like enzyme, putative cysteine protease [Malonomonas rubra DSM 5091]|uniref:Transglutaminase-like enzyme, putative cysteine protease n=1 Tax=Malonomonas rubra DSM 5091 TaxID=1122189 RepID=A0A1M6GFG4_MALRU|nr:transglutaminase family protein [Malonomonas rubra]SHJ08621.1 Transglutaminase-like enzyme, putative cysteine protease [Malonomonas rubra DSM 5091]
MRFRVTHITAYEYKDAVALCRNQAYLLPRQTPWQHCLISTLEIDPQPVDLRERLDPFGNRVSHFALQHAHKKLTVTAKSEIKIKTDPERFAAANRNSWDQLIPQLRSNKSPEILAALPFLYDSPLAGSSSALSDYARPSFPNGRPLADAAMDLMSRIYQDFTYQPGVTTVATPLSQVLKTRQGVCQDFAHLGVACLRSLGLPARYVSGYIETLPPPGQPRLVGADASHAWFSVFTGDAGWLDFDPTNNQLIADQHVTVAWGRDFDDVSPLRGVALGGGEHSVQVSVDVERVSEMPT